MDKQYSQVGTVTVAAGGTAETVTVGFSPSYVRAVSINNVTTYEHWDGMDDDTCIDTAAAVAVNAAGGITLTATGFTLGVDICDTTSDVVHWVAFR